MFRKGKLLKDIIPEDEKNKKNPRFYPCDSIIKTTPLGIYVEDMFSNYGNRNFKSVPLAGWIYKNVKNQEANVELVENIDFVFFP